MIAHLRSTESDTRAHDNIGPRLLLSVWILCGVAAIFLGLRVYCKILGRRGLWWDDGFLIGAFVSFLFSSAVSIHTYISYIVQC